MKYYLLKEDLDHLLQENNDDILLEEGLIPLVMAMVNVTVTRESTVVGDYCNIIFEDDFSSGDLSKWDGTRSCGAGAATFPAGGVLFDCPNGNNELNPPPEDEYYAYIDVVWPAGNILWVKCHVKIDSAGTDINIGGGFFMEFCSELDFGNYTNRWNVEFYSPAQEPGDPPVPYNGEYPMKICGNRNDGVHRIHAVNHIWVLPDVWHEVWMKVDYSGEHPKASWYYEGTFQEEIEDTFDLSVNCTKPPFFRIGQPWYDDAAKVKFYMDDFVMQENSF